ncbi:MAG: DUF6683 family protein [Acidobacteriota bacterium]
MKNKHFYKFVLMAVIGLTSVSAASAQYSTGYGTVYGSFGLAMATQNIYNASQMQMRQAMARNAMIAKWGLAAVQKAESEAAAKKSGTTAAASNPKIVVPPPPVVRNHGVFRPDPTIDTGTAFANAFGDTPDEKALIKQIYTNTKTAFEREAAAKGWKNNIAAGLTFFTVTAMTVHRDAEEPSDEAVTTYYKAVNAALDDTPAFATTPNKDKVNFNNMMVGFGGMLLAGYMEGKQGNDAATVETYRKLAGNLIQMVLKTDPENLRIENGQIMLK